MNWDDLNSEKNYSILFAYAQSKLANILFTTELARRFKGHMSLNQIKNFNMLNQIFI